MIADLKPYYSISWLTVLDITVADLSFFFMCAFIYATDDGLLRNVLSLRINHYLALDYGYAMHADTWDC